MDEKPKSNPNGSRYSRLIILREVEPAVYPYGSYKRVACKCRCGTVIETRLNKVLSGWTKSCGCLQKEMVVQKNYKHGGAKDPLYVIWLGMKQRCFYSKGSNYKYYGGRGIAISKEWEDYSNFRQDMFPSYQRGLTLDRIDVNGNYCKENCRWATPLEQSRNRRPKNYVKS